MTKRDLDLLLEGMPNDCEVCFRAVNDMSRWQIVELMDYHISISPGSVHARQQRKLAAKKAARTRKRNQGK